MTTVKDKIEIRRQGKRVEALALFNTGARRSYISDGLAEKVGYEGYPETVKVPLAVEGKEAESIGATLAWLRIAGYRLPEVERLGVIKGLREEVIVGVDIIEAYDLILDVKEGKVRFKKSPPELVLM